MPSVLTYMPPPEFVRRVMLRDGTAVFRANHLNPPAIWSKEVPRSKEAFAFGLFIAPIDAYLPCLEATQHLPIEAHPNEINHFPDPTSRAMRYWDGTMRGHDGSNYAKNMKVRQEKVVLRTYTYICEQNPELPVDSVLADLTARMQIPRTSVRHMLKQQGVTLPTSEAAQNAADSKLHKFDRAMQHHYMLLAKVVQQCRSSANSNKVLSTFTLTDLSVGNAPGGYPLRCPVLGVALDWHLSNHRSWYAPRVGRYDPGQPFIPGNVVLMSHLAKKLLEGKKFHTTVLELEVSANPGVPAALAAWGAQHPVPTTDAISEVARVKPQATPAPTKPPKEMSVRDILNEGWDEP